MFALLYLGVHPDSDFMGSCGRVGGGRYESGQLCGRLAGAGFCSRCRGTKAAIKVVPEFVCCRGLRPLRARSQPRVARQRLQVGLGLGLVLVLVLVLVVGLGVGRFWGGAVLPCRLVLRLLRSRTQPRSFGSCYDGHGEDGPLISGFSYDVSLSLS